MAATLEFDEPALISQIKKLPKSAREALLNSLDHPDDFWQFFEIIALDPLSTGIANQENPIRLGLRLRQI